MVEDYFLIIFKESFRSFYWFFYVGFVFVFRVILKMRNVDFGLSGRLCFSIVFYGWILTLVKELIIYWRVFLVFIRK